MLYTGATTAAAWALGEDFGGTAQDVSLVFMPIFWIGGEDLALVIPVVSGTRCVLMARWDVTGVWSAPSTRTSRSSNTRPAPTSTSPACD
jgi:long-chain acyl-CoA synthetase